MKERKTNNKRAYVFVQNIAGTIFLSISDSINNFLSSGTNYGLDSGAYMTNVDSKICGNKYTTSLIARESFSNGSARDSVVIDHKIIKHPLVLSLSDPDISIVEVCAENNYILITNEYEDISYLFLQASNASAIFIAQKSLLEKFKNWKNNNSNILQHIHNKILEKINLENSN